MKMSVFVFLLFSLETNPGLQRQHYLSATQSKVILTKHVLSSGNLQAFSNQPTSKSLDPYIRPRVAELGRLSSGAKMAMKIFVKRVFTIFASNASLLRVIANLQNKLSEICNIYHVIVHFLPKKHCF